MDSKNLDLEQEIKHLRSQLEPEWAEHGSPKRLRTDAGLQSQSRQPPAQPRYRSEPFVLLSPLVLYFFFQSDQVGRHSVRSYLRSIYPGDRLSNPSPLSSHSSIDPQVPHRFSLPPSERAPSAQAQAAIHHRATAAAQNHRDDGGGGQTNRAASDVPASSSMAEARPPSRLARDLG